MADTTLGGCALVIELVMRRFRCVSGTCPVVPFVEQVEHLARPHARRTPLLQRMLAQVAQRLPARLRTSETVRKPRQQIIQTRPPPDNLVDQPKCDSLRPGQTRTTTDRRYGQRTRTTDIIDIGGYTTGADPTRIMPMSCDKATVELVLAPCSCRVVGP
ncbi:hypothetical protein [Micromonospora sp. NPDC023814]|uniref:hypothetical protein n=1 Tax=Micromonospora sp. NPDC023814 TaxID=3154596 RepID=UPI0033D2A1CD